MSNIRTPCPRPSHVPKANTNEPKHISEKSSPKGSPHNPLPTAKCQEYFKICDEPFTQIQPQNSCIRPRNAVTVLHTHCREHRPRGRGPPGPTSGFGLVGFGHSSPREVRTLSLVTHFIRQPRLQIRYLQKGMNFTLLG